MRPICLSDEELESMDEEDRLQFERTEHTPHGRRFKKQVEDDTSIFDLGQADESIPLLDSFEEYEDE